MPALSSIRFATVIDSVWSGPVDTCPARGRWAHAAFLRTGNAALALLTCVAFNAIAAEPLRDPTQPPAALMPVLPAERSEAAGPVLQSIILRKGHKPQAIIGGERVELGGRYGELRLVRVNENSVVLQGPGGRETLQLTPAVQKTPRPARQQKPGSEK